MMFSMSTCTLCWFLAVSLITATTSSESDTDANATAERFEVVLVKIGGSSITNKASREHLNDKALDWFTSSISKSVSSAFLARGDDEDQECTATRDTEKMKELAFVIVHGAGSFGHHSAKDYGLRGQSEDPPPPIITDSIDNRFLMRGVSETRLSVQTLNRLVVESLLEQNVNAVGISPCFGIPGLEAHAHRQPAVRKMFDRVVRETLYAGLIPVLHGDACLFGQGGGILSGDSIMEILGTSAWVHHSVFITDVDGVFTEDPRVNPDAKLLKELFVDTSSGRITTQVAASSSSHSHDVTGGLAVSACVEDKAIASFKFL